jgi:hypothetical protein
MGKQCCKLTEELLSLEAPAANAICETLLAFALLPFCTPLKTLRPTVENMVGNRRVDETLRQILACKNVQPCCCTRRLNISYFSYT